MSGPEDLLRELRDPEHWQGLRAPRAGRSPQASRAWAARFAPAVAALAIAVLAVAGIGVGFASLHRGGTPAVRTSAMPTIEPSAHPGLPITGVVAGPPSSSTDDRSSQECTLDRLQLRGGAGGRSGSGWSRTLWLRNEGEPCLVATYLLAIGGSTLSSDGAGSSSADGILDPGDVLRVTVRAPVVCDDGASNIDSAHPDAIEVLNVGLPKATAVTFPRTACTAPSFVTARDPAAAFRFPDAPLAASVSTGAATGDGALRYTATVRSTGAAPVVLHRCPVVVEVRRAASGDEVSRVLTLACRVGESLQPGARAVLQAAAPAAVAPARTTAQDRVTWYFPPSSTTGSVAVLCASAQLRVSDGGEQGGEAGVFFGHLSVRNSGDPCVLPASAFRIGGRAPADSAYSLVLPARSWSTVLVSAAQRCGDASDSPNVPLALTSDAPERAQYETPIIVALGGRMITTGTLFPDLACSPASVRLQSG